MKAVLRTLLLALFAFGLFAIPCEGQDDSLRTFRNTVRLNLSNPILFSWKFNVIGYERLVKDYQSFSVNIGRTAMPYFKYFTDTLKLYEIQNDIGFNLSFDYRFFLQKENKYKAPRGIYIGPYYSFNYFSRDLTWDLETRNFTGEVITGFDVFANFFGGQLGYQFVFWDRLSIDLVLMGPGWWLFNMKANFDTELSDESEEMLLNQLDEILVEEFPGSDFLVWFNELEFGKKTSFSVTGFRYMLNIGFRF